MRERPIPFSAPMVHAILDGAKTQTRRICKPAEAAALSFVVEVPDPKERGQVYNGSHFGDEDGAVQFASPYGCRGDRLWVREAWRAPHSLDKLPPSGIADACLAAGYNSPWCPVQYEACGARNSAKDWHEFGSTPGSAKPGRYRHGRFMPRWASRITLEVTGVRVERLQAISEADARAEGCAGGHGSIAGYGYAATPSEHYRSLWESLNGAGSWDENPWVWVVEFRRIFGREGRANG